MKRKIFLKKKQKFIYGNILSKYTILHKFNENNELGLSLFYKNSLIKNFYFYNFFLKNCKNKFNNYYINTYLKNINNVYSLLPLFLLKKQCFSKNIDFFHFLKINSIKSFFFYKNFINLKPSFFFNFEIFKFYSNYSFILLNLKYVDLEKLNLKNEIESKQIYFFIKNKLHNEFKKQNFFLNKNFVFTFLINLEIYKILTQLNLNFFLNK